MSVFEPKVVQSILRGGSIVPPNERDKFRRQWSESVKNRVEKWKALPTTKACSRPLAQLQWEAEVLEYVTQISNVMRCRSQKSSARKTLGPDVPILGPRFVPPTYRHSELRPGTVDIQPDAQYLKPFNVIHPLYYPELTKCPRCQLGDKVSWEGWTATGPRELHGISCEESAIGLQLRCDRCKHDHQSPSGSEQDATEDVSATGLDDENNAKEDITGYCFALTSHMYWKGWNHWEIPADVPIFYKRCALTRELFDLVVELRPSTTSAGLAEHIKQLHLFEFHRRRLAYLKALERQHLGTRANGLAKFGITSSNTLKSFSTPDDPQHYADKSISHKVVTEVYLDFSTRTRQAESEMYLRSLPTQCGSIDNTFKSANKATITDSHRQKTRELRGGILTMINEVGEIVAWRLCQTQANTDITQLLTGVRRRQEAMGLPSPDMIVADNCCHVRRAVESAFPDTHCVLDAWHFIARYVAVIVNSKKNSHRAAVATDITNAVLKKHSIDGSGAQYWSRGEQEERLEAAFAKWDKTGAVWSAAAMQVHNEQLKHVRKGCLERRRQDIPSDGSRIEGSHKGWNSLQRAQPSGIVVLVALGHDFVLRRNVRVAYTTRTANTEGTFLASTHGSHHIGLVTAIATLRNRLLKSGIPSKGGLVHLAELPDIQSGESFGLAASDHMLTFGGLVDVKAEPAELDGIAAICSPDPMHEDTADLMVQASHSVLEELNIDVALLSKAATTIGVKNTAATTKRKLESEPAPTVTDDGMGASATVVAATTTKRARLGSLTRRSVEAGAFPLDKVAIPEADAACSGRLDSYIRANDAPTLTHSSFSRNASVQLPSSLMLPSSPVEGLTRSERLFSLATKIDPRSLVLKEDSEFYLFMDMRAEFCWASHEMTQKRWLDATVEFNRRLSSKCGASAVLKHPLALLRKLGEIEPMLMNRLLKGDYKSKRNTEEFWKKHCHAVGLVKPDAEKAPKKSRKAQVCSRCRRIMYPGPENSPLNHKKGHCNDGVRQIAKDDAIPLWPQPQGIFTGGKTFHLRAFYTTIQDIYERYCSPGATSPPTAPMETVSFITLLESRTRTFDDGTIGFRLLADYELDLDGMTRTPESPYVVRAEDDGNEYVRITYLAQPQPEA